MTSNPLNRRDFLQNSALGAAALSLPPLSHLRDERILIVLQLSGGNDYLNTVVPYGDDAYHRARRTLRKRQKDCVTLTDGLGLNNQLKELKALYDDDQVAIVQGVGYPNPNRSHFKSMDIWHSADPSDRPKKSGWLGRYAAAETKKKPDPAFMVNLAAQPPLALQGDAFQPISFQNPNSYRFVGSKEQAETFERINKVDKDRNAILELLGKTADNARTSSEKIRRATSRYRTAVKYGRDGLARSFKNIAALLHAGLPTRVFYVYHNGFDTHANQARNHDRLLLGFGNAMKNFQDDLKRLGMQDRVVTMVFSEFGRRVKENGSRGTDHGTAGASFVIGAPVKGGLYGKQPDLKDLVRGDLRHNVDFRNVYATLLRDWLKTNPREVLGNDFKSLPLFG